MYKLLILLLSLMIFTVNIYAKKDVYISTKRSSGNIDFYITNNTLFDITFKYDSIYSGMLCMDDLPIENIVKSRSKKKVVSFMISAKKYKYNNKFSWVVGNKYKRHNNKYIYSLPYAKGTSQTVTQGFNGKFSHKGNSLYAVDFGMRIGTRIYAAREGLVVLTKNNGNSHGVSDKYKKEANFITIKHSDGTYAKYVHLKKGGVQVKLGQKVKRGQFIGYSGNTGYTNGPHLHFVVFTGKDYKSRKSIKIKFRTTKGKLLEPIKGKKYISAGI